MRPYVAHLLTPIAYTMRFCWAVGHALPSSLLAAFGPRFSGEGFRK